MNTEFLRLKNISLERHLADEIESHRITQEIAKVYRQNLEIWQERATNLREVCKGLIDYRDRNSALNFQLEKADDFINAMRATIARSEGQP